MNYDVDYFIKKFEAIPEEFWMTGSYTDGNRCCAYGHCGIYKPGTNTNESNALAELIYPYCPASINDGAINNYPQKTPKRRILAALYDIKNKMP